MKPDTKRYILCDSIQMKFKKQIKLTSGDRNQNRGNLWRDCKDWKRVSRFSVLVKIFYTSLA